MQRCPRAPAGPRPGMGRRVAIALSLLPLLGLAGCGAPAFHLTVTFPGPVDLQVGAPVRYQGVVVGAITDVKLGQDAPSEPGHVELRVAIDDGVVLREGDVFEVASDGIMGEHYLRVLPATQDSPPLEPGARVAGRPALEERVVETAEEALARLGRIAREQAELLVDELEEQFADRSLRPEASETTQPTEPEATTPPEAEAPTEDPSGNDPAPARP